VNKTGRQENEKKVRNILIFFFGVKKKAIVKIKWQKSFVLLSYE